MRPPTTSPAGYHISYVWHRFNINNKFVVVVQRLLRIFEYPTTANRAIQLRPDFRSLSRPCSSKLLQDARRPMHVYQPWFWPVSATDGDRSRSTHDLARRHHSPTDFYARCNTGCFKGSFSATDRGARYISPSNRVFVEYLLSHDSRHIPHSK